MADVLVGRQPIFTADERLHGYELLFRSAAGGPIEDPEHATAQVLVNTFLEFGLASLVGTRQPFVNVTRPFLSGDIPLPFEPGEAMLEILETVEVDDGTVADVERLVAAGHRFALDDYVDTPAARRLLGLAEIIKIDVLATSPEEVAQLAALGRDHGLQLLAEKVETPAQLEHCQSLGFDFYQGYLLAKPVVLQQKSIGPTRLALIQLVTALGDPGSTNKDIEAWVRMDPALSYRVLRVVNSAGAGLRRKLSSIFEALVVLGRSTLRRWLLVMILAEGTPAANELLVRALVRSRMCELLSASAGVPADVAFTGGLLSALDRLLGSPLADIVASLPLDEEMQGALLRGEGGLGRLIRAVVAYEEGSVTGPLSIAPEVLVRAWGDAVSWAVEATELAATAQLEVPVAG